MGERGVPEGGVGESEIRRFVGDGFESGQPSFRNFRDFLVIAYDDFERHGGGSGEDYARLGMAMTRPPWVAVSRSDETRGVVGDTRSSLFG